MQVPALLVFLGVGMLIGTDGLGWIDFSDYKAARFIGSVALLLILFEAGLASGLERLRPVLRPAISLAVVGTVLTALIAGLAAHWLFGFSVEEGLLVGAILSPTDGAAVFALLRGSGLRSRLRRTLEGEAGFNDPIAVLLVLVMIEVIAVPDYSAVDGAWFLARETGIGAGAGIVVGLVGREALRRLGPDRASLALVGSFAAAAIAFGGAGALDGSGFLAVFVAGLLIGERELPLRPAVTAFHGGLAATAEIGLFLALGLLVFPSQLGDVLVKGTLLGLVVALVARPVAAAAATAFERDLSARERLLLGWAGLRGAVPVVLATFPVIRGVPGSLEFFNIVFFAVLVSTLIQGTTVQPLARRLHLDQG
jgi:cell volume regulation protein A